MRLVRTVCIDTLTSPTAAPTVERLVEIRGDESTVVRVLTDIRARVARGERTPVTADHLRSLGLDDVLLELAQRGA